MKHQLNLNLSEDHPAYQWAKKQSDSVNAFGHIGTHIDCYSKVPEESHYELDFLLIDCLDGMPSASDIEDLELENKALILYTGVLDKYGYGTKSYGETNTFLSENVLDRILSKKPQFILIDACGIGNHGEEHIRFDQKCEQMSCFVIENILINSDMAMPLNKLEIIIDISSRSTGKTCKIYGY